MADILKFLDDQVFPFIAREEALKDLELEDRGVVENIALHMRVVAQKNQYKKELEETGTRPSSDERPKPVRYLN